MMPTPSAEPGPVLASVAVAADLAGCPRDALLGWVADGRVRSERINGIVYVNLDDAMATAGDARRHR